MSNGLTFIRHKLTENEKKLLSYEFSNEHIYYVLVEFQSKFNEVYRCFINIFRKIFNYKRNNKNLKEEIEKQVDDLEKLEQKLLNKYKIILLHIKLSKLDFNNADIFLEFIDKNEEERFFNSLNFTKNYLERYRRQMEELEELKNKINSVYEKVISYSCLDIPK